MPDPQPAPSPYRILSLDDDPGQGALYREYLQYASGLTVDTVAHPDAFWDCLAAGAYDLIMLDYRLQSGTGIEILEALNQKQVSLPVLMVTGQGDERIAVQAIQMGAYDYVVKTGDYLPSLPSIIKKTIQMHRLKQSVEQSLAQVRYQALLLNNMRDAVVVWDLDGEITFWNPAAYLLFGYTPAERVGRQVEEVYLHAFEPGLILPQAGSTSGQEVERCYQAPNGRELWISSRVVALHDSKDPQRLLGYMDVARNITRRKLEQQALAESEARFRELSQQLLATQTQLAQAARLSAVGQLASSVAHLISNPLTTIIAETQLQLHELAPGDPRREGLQAVEQAGWRAQRVVQQLLAFSTPIDTPPERILVSGCLERALALVRPNFDEIGAHVLVQPCADEPPVRANPRQLEEMWLNLLLSRRDAFADGAKHQLRITFRRVADTLEACMQDDGAWPSVDSAELLFDPVMLSPASCRGTGMELAISREIIHQHRGKISLLRPPGSGVTLVLQFPLE